MAVVLAFRIAIYLAGRGTARIYTATGAGGGASSHLWLPWLRERLAAGDSDEDLSAGLSERMGILATVATYNEPFELRQWQAIFSRESGNVEGDDVALFTWHNIKLAGGSPSADWVAGDYSTIAGHLSTLWSSLKGWYHPGIKLRRYKAYKAGPDISPPQVAVYDTGDVGTTIGTSSGNALPPQVALTVTEKAGSKPHWGRYYLPAPAITGPAGAATLTANGRPSSAFLTAVADAFDVFNEAAVTAGLPIVVYRRPLPERENAAGATLPARDGSAWTVETLQVDDVFDVMRTRRWKLPTVRVLRGIGA